MEKNAVDAPVLSIIIATYNAANTLEETLASISSQQYGDFECIVVDGLSKDTTIDIVKKYAETDSRIKYISEKDSGIYDAYNKGWKLAVGKWIYYIGADDVLLPDCLSKVFNKEPKADAFYGNIHIRNKRGVFPRKSNPDIKSIKYKVPSHQSIFMKRELIASLNGFDMQYRICADADLIVRAFVKGAEFVYIDVDIAVFSTVLGASSTSITNVWEGYRLRKRNKTIGCFANVFILLRNLARKSIRLLFWKIFY